jgi:hypothetical protein
MFSLCIPTMDRYDSFLKRYLPEYLKNDLIDEIIISDENGNDAKKIQRDFPNNNKIIINVNSRKLGPFLNKLTCCKLAKNEWITLIDSDNFADINYFNISKKFIEDNHTKIQKNSILAPSWAQPNFNYTNLSNVCINKKNLKQYNKNQPGYTGLEVLMNTGNYIINKYLISNIYLNNDIELINNSSACDVILFNTMLLEQLDLHIYIVANLHYSHIVHEGSIYTTTISQTHKYANIVYNRYNQLIVNS